ncbi:DUF6126 family protein [Streptomyces sp. NPDC050355]|uniref:DUF6126 family protein n=1 Tax=Streptomyces sp. NPDC050355 TaxID=3365609 RepID=UPI0037A0D661
MPDHSTPHPADRPDEALPAETLPTRRYVENKPPRGVYVRVFIYVVATHVLLAFMSLLVVVAKSR